MIWYIIYEIVVRKCVMMNGVLFFHWFSLSVVVYSFLWSLQHLFILFYIFFRLFLGSRPKIQQKNSKQKREKFLLELYCYKCSIIFKSIHTNSVSSSHLSSNFDTACSYRAHCSLFLSPVLSICWFIIFFSFFTSILNISFFAIPFLLNDTAISLLHIICGLFYVRAKLIKVFFDICRWCFKSLFFRIKFFKFIFCFIAYTMLLLLCFIFI